MAMDKTVHSVQAILPDADNPLKRDKTYLAGGDKRGHFFRIGQPKIHNDKHVVLVAEGFATAASLHKSTGHCVFVAFDAGNLKPVAKAIRDKVKTATIVLCADNDRFTAGNPGRTRARQAAAAVGGLVALPEFDGAPIDGDKKGTDFNDLAMMSGTHDDAAVIAVIEAAIEANVVVTRADIDSEWVRGKLAEVTTSAVEHDALAGPLTAEEQNEEQLEQDDIELPRRIFPQSAPMIPAAAMLPSSAADKVPAKAAIASGQEIDASSVFAILGHGKEEIYVYSMERHTVLTTSSSKLNKMAGLMDLAPVNWWEAYFNKPCKSGPNVDVANAANWVIRKAGERGPYDTARVRGRGVWIDEGRNVFHHGSHLSVDGKVVQLGRIRSSFVYESGVALPEPAKQGLTDAEGAALVAMMSRFSWAKPGSGLLLAGWIFLAPICGALKWRPHLWLTGGAGTGKSTLMEDVINHVTVPEWMLYLHGSTTEAGVRQNLQSDARPVMLDEFECNSPKDIPRIESILTLIRQSSSESGAKIGRGTVSGQAMSFSARSMFCLASVGVSLSRQTDEDRITRLDLTGGMPSAKWDALKGEIDTIHKSGDYSPRMFTRSLGMISVAIEACDTFKKLAGVELGRQRDGDQIGTLLAGAWCMQNVRAPSLDDAKAFMGGYDWKEFVASASGKGDDSHQALDAVLAARLVGEFGKWMSVGELLASVRAGGNNDDEAHQVLKRHGIRISPKGESVMFATGMRALTDLVQGTPFENDLVGRLARIGRKSIRDEKQKFTGPRPFPFVAVPVETVFGDNMPVAA
jgi:putative DNA primase/helicase